MHLMKHEMGGETVEDENMWTTNEGAHASEVHDRNSREIPTTATDSQYRWN
jgi:hypothetical protein